MRNVEESSFLGSGAYRSLPSASKGIAALRVRLSQLLYSLLKDELPKLRVKLNEKIAGIESAIANLGEKRSTFPEQRRFLLWISAAYQAIVQAATDGHYEDAFFGEPNLEAGFSDPTNMRRLRAAVQHLNEQFASQVRKYGHKYRIKTTKEHAGTNWEGDAAEPALDPEFEKVRKGQGKLTREQATERVNSLMVFSRGKELPGNFNPILMGQLFRDLSQPWESLAKAQLERINTLCTLFVHAVIDHVAAGDLHVSQRLQEAKLDTALKRRYDGAQAELAKVIADKQKNIITYDPSYTDNLNKARERKLNARFQAMLAKASVNGVVNTDSLVKAYKEEEQRGQERTIAEDALDSQLAFYRVSVPGP